MGNQPMATNGRFAPGIIRLRDATPADIVRLASAKAWAIGPDMLDALKDPHSPERRKVALVDQLSLPGAIDLVVDPRLPKGYVLPQGVPLLIVPPRREPLSAQQRKDRSMPGVVLLLLQGLVIAVIVVVLVAFALAAGYQLPDLTP